MLFKVNSGIPEKDRQKAQHLSKSVLSGFYKYFRDLSIIYLWRCDT